MLRQQNLESGAHEVIFFLAKYYLNEILRHLSRKKRGKDIKALTEVVCTKKKSQERELAF